MRLLCAVLIAVVACHAMVEDGVSTVELGDGATPLEPTKARPEAGKSEVKSQAALAATKARQNADKTFNTPASANPWGKGTKSWEVAAKKPGKVSVAKTSAKAAPAKAQVVQVKKEAGPPSPYDMASKAVPLRFEIVQPPAKKGKDDDEAGTMDALSGKSERRFNKQIGYLAGLAHKDQAKKMAKAMKDERIDAEEKQEKEMKGAVYMQAYDAEKRRIGMEDAQKAARDQAVSTAIKIKAQAVADERKTAAVAAVKAIKAAEARMDSAQKGVDVADSAVQKGWLKPKLAAEMKMTQKRLLKGAEKGVKKARKKEKHLKWDANNKLLMNERKGKKKAHMQGKRAAAAAVEKEMAMKFVKSEFERRKKAAFKAKRKDAELNRRMAQSAEIDGKKDAARENRAKANENAAKGKATEKFKKNKVKEKEAKLVAASQKPRKTNCKVGPWMPWKKCTRACSGGMQARTRQVKVPSLNAGAACPDLLQSRPCNMQPCLEKSFALGYCNRALRGCMKYRALERGCHSVRKVFGFGSGINRIMIDEHDKMERKIRVIQNRKGRGDANQKFRDIIKQEDRKAIRTVKKIVKAQGSGENPHQSRDNRATRASASSNDGASASVDHNALDKSITVKPTLGEQPKAAFIQPKFQFHPDGKGTAEVLHAVAAAERGVTSTEGAAATKYQFKLAGPTPLRERDLGESVTLLDLEESGEVQSMASHSKSMRKIVDPINVSKAQSNPKAHMSQMEAERCAKYKNGVAHFCGRMVDCVGKQQDKRDINYSKTLTKQGYNMALPNQGATPVGGYTTSELTSRGQIKPVAWKKAAVATPSNHFTVPVAKDFKKSLIHHLHKDDKQETETRNVKTKTVAAGKEQQQGAGLFPHHQKAAHDPNHGA
jgi:hypothetical protein